MSQSELFAITSPEVQKVDVPRTNDKPRWTRYKAVNPYRCDDCMHLLFITNGNAPLSRQAKYKRVAGESVRYLCLAHAQQWREDDEMRKLPGPRK